MELPAKFGYNAVPDEAMPILKVGPGFVLFLAIIPAIYVCPEGGDALKLIQAQYERGSEESGVVFETKTTELDPSNFNDVPTRP